MAHQHHPVGPDALADGLQVDDVAGDGVAAGVVKPAGAAGADLVVDEHVETVPGELPEVGGVAGHVGDAGAAVQEHHRAGPRGATGGQVHVGNPRAGRQRPEPLAGHGCRGALRVADRDQRRGPEHGHASEHAGGDGDQPGPPTPLIGKLAGGQSDAGGGGGHEDDQTSEQENGRPGRHRRHRD
jgi:hypothetical protein